MDVDDTPYHGSALSKSTGEVLEFKCRPNLGGLLGQLNKVHKYLPGSSLRIGYGASYMGYTLQRIWLKKVIIVMSLFRPASPVPVENKSKRIVLIQHNWRDSISMIC